MMNDKIAVYRIDEGLGYTHFKDGEVQTSLYFSGFEHVDEFYVNAIRTELSKIEKNSETPISADGIIVNMVPACERTKFNRPEPLSDKEYRKVLNAIK